jgi:hypothetical protein
MARPDVGTYTPESLATIATALQSIMDRMTRTAEAMKEKKVASLEVKNQAALKSAITALRGFGMAAEEALEEWLFDQNLFKGSADSVEEAAIEPAKPRPGRKQKKEHDAVAEDLSGDET